MNETANERLLLRNLTIITVDDCDQVLTGDISVQNGLIQEIAPYIEPRPDDVELRLDGMIAMPAFIQTHVHTCQTLWRNLADDMSLMDWLWKRTWPYEAAMTADMVRASVRLSAAELLLSGTLAVNDFGLVHHVETIARTAAETGLRGVWARILMDDHDGPESLRDDPDTAVTSAVELAARISGIDDAIGFSLAPRFAVSCSGRLLEMVRQAAVDNQIPIHTHCSENDRENELTVDKFGLRPVRLYEKMGMLGPGLRLAHCVRIDDDEIRILAETDTRVLHCPSTNLKLASGIAPVPAMLDAGIPVSIGADGAPANNNLDMFVEMRAASLIQKPFHGPDVMTAAQVLRMATVNGAITLGIDDTTGSLRPGLRADILILDPRGPHCVPFDEPEPAIVYSMGRGNVRHLLSAGKFVVRDQVCTMFDADSAIDDAIRESRELRKTSKI